MKCVRCGAARRWHWLLPWRVYGMRFVEGWGQNLRCVRFKAAWEWDA